MKTIINLKKGTITEYWNEDFVSPENVVITKKMCQTLNFPSIIDRIYSNSNLSNHVKFCRKYGEKVTIIK